MTRWVRSGSSQKHKKMPGNATRWGEFDNQFATKFLPKKKKIIESQTDIKQKIQSPSTDFQSQKPKKSLDEDFFEEDKYCLNKNTNLLNEVNNDIYDENHSNTTSSLTNNEGDNSILLINKSHSTKMKKKNKKKNFDFKYTTSLDEKNYNVDSSNTSKNNIKNKLEKDYADTNSSNMCEQDSDHNDFVENTTKIDAKESNFQQQSKKKRKRKTKEKYNQIDLEGLTTNNKCMKTSYNNSEESLNLDQKDEGIESPIETNESNMLFQEIGRSKKQKRKKYDKVHNDLNQSSLANINSENPLHCSVTTSNNMLEQNSNHSDFAENKIGTEETFVPHQKKKKRKEKCNKIDSDSLTLNDMETTIDHNVDCNTSKEISEHSKSFQEIDKSSKKQKKTKDDKVNNDSNQSSVTNDNSKNSSSKVFENKKEKHLKRLQKKREKLGLLLLPRNVENKLHKINKRLKEKGFPPEKQKEIMRQARRTEELKYRKIFNPSKLCFGCREPGHVLAECPKKSESLKQETGICFKCGSVEHTSFKCPEKIQGFPYAKCFICQEQGHISRECPRNKHGVYPKGGKCKLCGNVNHLKKDCPTLKKKETEEETMTLDTLSENTSIDAELVKKEVTEKKPSKKAKIVKF